MPIDRLLCLLVPVLLPAHALADDPVLGTVVDEKYLDGYQAAVEPLLNLSEAEMLALIPQQSGIYFTDCVNCEMGRQEGQFHDQAGAEFTPWSVEEPDILRCAYCGHEYPSAEYPMDQALDVVSPRGEVWKYPYYEDADGYKHHFAATLDYRKIRYMERRANSFARLYAITGDESYARRSALIMARFAEVFPGY
ncbi:MAG TPA: heparinase, partial [Armatimonadota bacterium]|nr:heparinase [Armatimonadota bacterium]